jgi:hypothetical protein
MGIGVALTYLEYPRMSTPPEDMHDEHAGATLQGRGGWLEVVRNKIRASMLTAEIALRSSEKWMLERYLTMDVLTRRLQNRTDNF